MSDDRFEASWLELREPVDHRSRPLELLPPLQEAWERHGWRRVLDLGSGTGSNLRYLSPRLPGPQSWTLVDHDVTLLEQATDGHPGGAEAGRKPGPPVELHLREGDLADVGLSEADDAHLVTASALLDLVAEGWLSDLVERISARGAGALLALSYDGRVRWSGPAHPHDPMVLEAVNAHQRRDKGLGPALGPAAGAVAEGLFRDAGYRTWLRPSPWTLTPEDRALSRELVAGWAAAAAEEKPEAAEAVEAWARHRTGTLASGTLTVGHLDLLALP